jgi:hypothetical protein
VVLVADQALLPWPLDPLARWFTPAMGTAYILWADAWALRRRRRSLLHDHPGEAAFILSRSGSSSKRSISAAGRWAYFGVPAEPALALFAHGGAFATIGPGLFETAAALGVPRIGGRSVAGPAAGPTRVPTGGRWASAIGALFLVAPLLLLAAVRPGPSASSG